MKSCRESLRAPSNVAKHTVKNEMVLTSNRTKIVTFLGNFHTMCLCNLKIVLRFCWCSFQTKKPIIVFLIIFCLIKTDLSDNTILSQASDFQKLAKIDHIWHFWLFFVRSKCKRSLLLLTMLKETYYVIFKHRVAILQIDKFSHGSSRAHSPPFLHWTVL